MSYKRFFFKMIKHCQKKTHNPTHPHNRHKMAHFYLLFIIFAHYILKQS